MEKTSFGPGHKTGLFSGQYSKEIVEARAPVVLRRLIDMYPMVLDFPEWVIERYVKVEARLDLMYEYFMELCATVGIAQVPSALNSEIAKAEQISLNYAKELGITPAAWASIAKNMGFARHFSNEKLDGLASEGRRIRTEQGRLSSP